MGGLALLLLLPAGGQAKVLSVANKDEFVTALAQAGPGDVIQLANTQFPALQIAGHKYAGTVRIVGSGSTSIAALSISGSAEISLENLTVTPAAGAEALVTVNRSSAIKFAHVKFNGIDEGTGTELDIGKDASDVQIADSEFTQCRSGSPCLQPGGNGITVLRSNFHDCYDCDMVRGGGSNVTFIGNTLQRAFRGSCVIRPRGGNPCNHNDLIQIMGGGPWTIVGNRFGERHSGSAQIWMDPGVNNADNPIHDVHITSNVFTGTMLYSIRIGKHGLTGPPRNVEIVNNTILAGTKSAVGVIPDAYAQMPESQRPLVANNILGAMEAVTCPRIHSTTNLVITGHACSSADRVGAANLSSTQAPTASSVLVINAADPALAPPTDMLGHSRNGAPDLGAIEYNGVVQLQLTLPHTITVHLKTLARQKWAMRVRVGTNTSAALKVRFLRGGRSVAVGQGRAAKGGTTAVTIHLPRIARRRGNAYLVVSATAPGARPLTRRILLHIVA
ncbi:MAG: hypothetical protein C5B48_01075 [Candidatus Rokuibacteriota bacterium]|nr:MAG: hypothetical protein C5B48_01075 [Candidatus Rokubacteria bacterium]